MNFKYITAGAIALLMAVSSVGCSSGGLTGVHNPVPDRAQASSSEISSQVGNTVDYSALANIWLNNETVWANTDIIPAGGISGVYSTGYYLFDIDLDGSREMLVQLGGDHSQNCNTLVYKLSNDGQITQIPVEDGLSFSVQKLTLWNDESGMFYINESTVKNDEDIFITSWNRMSITDGVLVQQPLFYQHVTYDTLTGNMDLMLCYADDGITQITDEEFFDRQNAYFEKCTQTIINPKLIKSKEWQYYTRNQKLNEIINAYTR